MSIRPLFQRVFVSAGLLFAAFPAAATTLTCDTVGDPTFKVGPSTGNAGITVFLKKGETLTISTSSGSLGAEINEVSGGNKQNCDTIAGQCNAFNYTAERTGDHFIEAFNGTDSTFTLACGAGAAGGGAAGPDFAKLGAQSAQAGGAAQGRSIKSAVSAAAVNQGVGTRLSTKGLTLSTSGTGSAWTAWAMLGGRQFDGTLDGNATDLSFGLGRDFGAATAGLLVNASRLDGAIGALNSDSVSYAVGPYVAARLGGGFGLEGYLTYGQVAYSLGAASFDADRTMAGLRLTSDTQAGGLNFTSFLSVDGYRENQEAYTVGATAVAANTVASMTGSLGTTIWVETQLSGATLRPYLTLALDANRFDDGVATSRFQEPRAEIGVTGFGRASRFSFAIDTGRVEAGTRDVGVSASYVLRF